MSVAEYMGSFTSAAIAYFEDVRVVWSKRAAIIRVEVAFIDKGLGRQFATSKHVSEDEIVNSLSDRGEMHAFKMCRELERSVHVEREEARKP